MFHCDWKSYHLNAFIILGARDVPFILFINKLKTFANQFVDTEKIKQRDRNVSTSSGSSKDDTSDNEEGAAGSLSSSASSNSKINMDYIQQFFASKLRLFRDDHELSKDHQVLKTVDLDGIVEHWNNNGFKKIITMVGAGISTCKFK